MASSTSEPLRSLQTLKQREDAGAAASLNWLPSVAPPNLLVVSVPLLSSLCFGLCVEVIVELGRAEWLVEPVSLRTTLRTDTQLLIVEGGA